MGVSQCFAASGRLRRTLFIHFRSTARLAIICATDTTGAAGSDNADGIVNTEKRKVKQTGAKARSAKKRQAKIPEDPAPMAIGDKAQQTVEHGGYTLSVTDLQTTHTTHTQIQACKHNHIHSHTQAGTPTCRHRQAHTQTDTYFVGRLP